MSHRTCSEMKDFQAHSFFGSRLVLGDSRGPCYYRGTVEAMAECRDLELDLACTCPRLGVVGTLERTRLDGDVAP